MKDYYPTVRQVIDNYNNITNEIVNGEQEINEDQEEFMMNFCMYLAHALIKDTGGGDLAREELSKMADLINDVIR